MYQEYKDENKRQAAEFISSQVYDLTEERRKLIQENDQLV